MKSFNFRIIATGGAAAILFACNNSANDTPKAPPPQSVNTYLVEKAKAVNYDKYPATVTALNQVDLRAQVTGYITGIYFKDGQRVTKGQKLYDIDKQQYLASYDQAVANLNVSKSNLDRAQRDAERYTDLFQKDAVAKQVYDHAMADLQSAKMQVQAAQSTVKNVEATVSYSEIHAPFSGTIGFSQVKMGALVTANQTLLNTISSDDPMAVDIAVDQRDLPRFENLEKNYKPGDSTFMLLLPDNSIYDKTGKIVFIDRAIDPTTGTIKTRLLFANPDNFLKAGMNTNVRIRNNNGDSSVLLIPYKAVMEQMGEFFVFVVNDSSRAFQHKVSLGDRINDQVIIKSGLQEGDKIITDGVQKVKDSARVQAAPPANKK